MIFGNFNDVRFCHERKGSKMDERETKTFNDFIRGNNLIDVKISGTNFTWIKGGGEKLSKLDRFLISADFADIWPNEECMEDSRLL